MAWWTVQMGRGYVRAEKLGERPEKELFHRVGEDSTAIVRVDDVGEPDENFLAIMRARKLMNEGDRRRFALSRFIARNCEN